jgi:hypothetical protein
MDVSSELRNFSHSHGSILAAILLALLVLAAISNGLRLIWDLARGALWMLRGLPLLRHDRLAQRERAARRRLFADHVEGRMRALAAKEQWSDHRYAELEAEVETVSDGESAGAIVRFFVRRSGLRRERSLTRALISTRERVVLLQGDPGSGKSIALRHVARVMARKAMSSRRVNTVIPIYINLKSLKPDGRPIDANMIEAYVLSSLREKSTADLDRFLDAEFSLGITEGTWLFLFDSFDEIPDVLAATDVDDIILTYSEAIHSFLTTMRKCRGVVASRQFRAPRRVGWPTWTVVPLTAKRKHELVRRAELGPEATSTILTQLPVAEVTMAGLPSNPMFLGLLCEYVRDQGHMPVTSHAVFEEYTAQRFLRDADRVRERYALEPTQIRGAAERMAFCMVAAPGLGLDPTRGEIKAELARRAFRDTIDVDTAMDALEYLKLARGDEGESRDDSRSFTFAHRRFQEYFATCVVIAAPALVAPGDLLADGRWREIAVTLCQVQEAAVEGILAEAERRMTLMASTVTEVSAIEFDAALHGGRRQAPSEDFAWPAGSLHLLGILQAGFGSRDSRLPPGLRLAVSRILAAAFVFGQIYDRKWALDVGATAGRAVFTSLVRGCFRSGSDWLRDAAYTQVARLGEIPEGISREMRRTLLRMEGTGQLRRERVAVSAQVKRLRSSSELIDVVRLLRAASYIDLLAHLLAACALIVLTFDHDLDPFTVMLCSALIIFSAYSFKVIALTLGRREGPSFMDTWGASANSKPGASPYRDHHPLLQELVPVFRAGVPFILLTPLLTLPFMWYTLPIAIGVLYVMSLGPFLLLDVEAGRYLGLRTLLLPQIVIVSALKRRSWWLELLRGVTAIAVMIGVLVAAPAISKVLQREVYPSHSDKVFLSIAVGLIAALIALWVVWTIVMEVRDWLHDVRWHAEWRKLRTAAVAPESIVQWIAAQRTAWGIRRLATELRTERLLQQSISSIQLVEDLIAACESAIAGPDAYEEALESYQWQSPEVERWLSGGHGTRGLLVTLGTSFIDELGRLIEDLSPEGLGTAAAGRQAPSAVLTPP